MGAFSTGQLFVNTKTRKVLTGSQEIDFHGKMTGEHVKKVKDNVYIDGFKLVDGGWRRSIRAMRYQAFK